LWILGSLLISVQDHSALLRIVAKEIPKVESRRHKPTLTIDDQAVGDWLCPMSL